MRSLTLTLIPLLFLSSCSMDGNKVEDTIQFPQTSTTHTISGSENTYIINTGGTTSKALTSVHMGLVGIKMQGSSMVPTIKDGDIMKVRSAVKEINHGDIIVFGVGTEKYVKRVIGLPGETIMFSSGEVFLKGVGSNDFIQINEPYILTGSNRKGTFLPGYLTTNSFIVPENMYWVMGDNRYNSADSRSCFRFCTGKDSTEHFLKPEEIYGLVIQ